MKGGKYDPCQGNTQITAQSMSSGACGRLGSKVLLFAFQYGGQIDVFLSNRLFETVSSV